MIDIEKGKKELVKHVQEIGIRNQRVEMKIGHIMRVVENCEKLAVALGLTEEQIQVVKLIGLLHDIGRFEQYQIKDTTRKFDHGEAGVEVLKKDNYIRKYIPDDSYDAIIYTAIYEHNKYELPKDLSKEETLFCKIIKDADKIDLLYEAVYIYWQTPERIQQVEEGELSTKMLEDFYQYKLADNRNRVSETDQILRFASFIFDIHFTYSFKILKENENIKNMLERFHYQVPQTQNEMMKVKKIVEEYVNKNANGC